MHKRNGKNCYIRVINSINKISSDVLDHDEVLVDFDLLINFLLMFLSIIAFKIIPVGINIKKILKSPQVLKFSSGDFNHVDLYVDFFLVIIIAISSFCLLSLTRKQTKIKQKFG